MLECGISNNDNNLPISEEVSPVLDSTVNTFKDLISNSCELSLIDFFKLKDKNLQSEFFFKLDSVRKVQYTNIDQEKSIFVDLTPEYLDKFLDDIDIDSILTQSEIEMKYHFNIAPKGYKDPEMCLDALRLRLDKEFCQFTMVVYNTFLVEPDWCTESAVIYGFKLSGNKIIDFWRNEAG